DLGIPIQEQYINKNHNLSEILMLLEKSKNLLVCGSALTPDELENLSSTGKIKKNAFLYYDKEISEIISQMETDQDWEDFFNDEDISYEVASQPEVYMQH